MKKSYPEHWVETTLKEVVVSKKGKKPKILKDKPFPKSSPYIDIEAFETGLIKQYADNESSNICVPTDVLVVWDGARFGLAGFGQSGSIGSTLACLTPIIVEPRYLYKFIQSHYSTIQQKPKGMATPHVDPDLFWNLELPLPPLNEQKRIAEKLDAILPKVKSARDRLEKIPAILKKFRQSVLAAACSGKLTEDWREGKNFNLHEYLEVIINERKKDKKYSKYLNTIIELKLPIEWSLENDVPESWLITKMGIICPKITDGTHDTPKRLKKGIPYITGKHIRDRYIDFNNCDYITIEEHKKIYARCNPEYDDVLMVNIGAGTATPARVNVTYEFSMKNVALLKVDNKLITGRYLEYHQLRFKDYIFNQITKGGAQPFLSLDIIKALPLYLPPLEEQHEIVRRVEKLFALADSIEEKYKKAYERLEKLEQAILARAFRGELVEPDPNDEPAEELLKRILEEKAKLEREQKGKKRKK